MRLGRRCTIVVRLIRNKLIKVIVVVIFIAFDRFYIALMLKTLIPHL